MRQFLLRLLIFSLLASCGCDSVVSISGALNQQSFAGTVSIVRLTVTTDNTQITFVTLIGNTTSQDFNFCGNVVNQFPMNASVQGSFTTGSTCGTIVRVTVTGWLFAGTIRFSGSHYPRFLRFLSICGQYWNSSAYNSPLRSDTCSSMRLCASAIARL